LKFVQKYDDLETVEETRQAVCM